MIGSSRDVGWGGRWKTSRLQHTKTTVRWPPSRQDSQFEALRTCDPATISPHEHLAANGGRCTTKELGRSACQLQRSPFEVALTRGMGVVLSHLTRRDAGAFAHPFIGAIGSCYEVSGWVLRCADARAVRLPQAAHRLHISSPPALHSPAPNRNIKATFGNDAGSSGWRRWRVARGPEVAAVDMCSQHIWRAKERQVFNKL